MPWHRHVPVSDFAPKAWAAMCELLGGEERITDSPEFRGWSDGFIVNLGKDEYSADNELDLRRKSNIQLPTNKSSSFAAASQKLSRGL